MVNQDKDKCYVQFQWHSVRDPCSLLPQCRLITAASKQIHNSSLVLPVDESRR